jgi:hypothetical protein
MGNRGFVELREEARRLRADAWTLLAIADHLGVVKSTVSLWVRDVEFVPGPRAASRRRAPNRLQQAKQAEIESAGAWGRALVGELSERDLLIAGAALYAGEGSKTRDKVVFANSDPAMVRLFLAWLRRFFAIDEARLRMRLYLHEGLDLDGALRFWSDVTDIPIQQFGKPYRAVPDSSIRSVKHPMGCASVVYNSSAVHRQIMALAVALLTSTCSLPG